MFRKINASKFFVVAFVITLVFSLYNNALATETSTRNITVYAVQGTPPTIWWMSQPLVDDYIVQITTSRGTYRRIYKAVSQFTIENVPSGVVKVRFIKDPSKKIAWVKGNLATLVQYFTIFEDQLISIKDADKDSWVKVAFVKTCVTNDCF